MVLLAFIQYMQTQLLVFTGSMGKLSSLSEV